MKNNGYVLGKNNVGNRFHLKKMIGGFIRLKQKLSFLREKQPLSLLAKRKHGASGSVSKFTRPLVNTKDDENRIAAHHNKSSVNKLPNDNNSPSTCLECAEDKSSDSSNGDNGNNNERKYKKRKLGITKDKLPKKSTRFLKRWLMQNINNPYPDSAAKEHMIKTSGLTRKQIQDWFTNARKRYLEPMKKKVVEIAKNLPAAPHNNKRQVPSPAITHNINVVQQSQQTTTIKEEKGYSINTTTYQTIQSSVNLNPSNMYGPLPRFAEIFNEQQQHQQANNHVFSLPIHNNSGINHSSYNSLFNRIFDATNQQTSPLEMMKKAQQQQMMSQFLVKQPNTFVIPPSFVPFRGGN